MKPTISRVDKGASMFVAATRQCIPMGISKVASGLLVAALALGWATTAAAEGLPVTGQTTCYLLERYPAGHPLGPDPVTGDPGQLAMYDANGNIEFLPDGQPNLAFDPNTGNVNDQVIPCRGTGQDGEYQMGSVPRFVDRGDGRITDRNTGLTWAKKGYDRGLHDKDNTYTWNEAFAFIHTMNNTCHLNQIAPGPNAPAPTPCLNNTGCPAVGDTCGFAGKRDWRLPNVMELNSLVNKGVFTSLTTATPTVYPAFNTNCVPGVSVLTGSCTHSDSLDNATDANYVPVGSSDPATGLRALPVPYTYWSSTTGDALGDAWFVDYTTGDGGAHFKETDIDIDTTVDPPLVTHAGHVRAVRGGESSLDQDRD